MHRREHQVRPERSEAGEREVDRLREAAEIAPRVIEDRPHADFTDDAQHQNKDGKDDIGDPPMVEMTTAARRGHGLQEARQSNLSDCLYDHGQADHAEAAQEMQGADDIVHVGLLLVRPSISADDYTRLASAPTQGGPHDRLQGAGLPAIGWWLFARGDHAAGSLSLGWLAIRIAIALLIVQSFAQVPSEPLGKGGAR